MTDIERAARASCRTTCVAMDCRVLDRCLAVNLGSEIDRARAAISAVLSEPSEEMVEAAVRAGCTAMDVHLRCTHPDCACKGLPVGIRAALIAVGKLFEGRTG